MQSNLGLTTKVKNVSGVIMRFSFLPPHGRELAVDEEFTFQGDLREHLSRKGPRFRAGLYSALENNSLDIIHTPDLVLYDATLDQSKSVALDNGSLDVEQSSWDSSF